MRALVIAAGVGCALVGGVFFAFSTFVLPALTRLPDAEAGRAMRAINVVAVRPPLMIALFGTAVLCAVLVVPALRSADGWVVSGCVVHLLGVVVVTVVANVPLNDRLARGELPFAEFAASWARWNHLRTLAGTAAAVLLLAGRSTTVPL